MKMHVMLLNRVALGQLGAPVAASELWKWWRLWSFWLTCQPADLGNLRNDCAHQGSLTCCQFLLVSAPVEKTVKIIIKINALFFR